MTTTDTIPPGIPTVPGKIVCLGRSFRAHAEELGNAVPTRPLYFLKATSAIIGPDAPILLPPESEDVQHEAEVAVVIARRLRRASPDEAESAIGAWTLLNDVTARDLQRADGGRFTRAKGYDTFCPLSDVRLPTLDWARCRVQCRVDGVLRQDGALVDLLWSPAEAIAAISEVMTLMPGDLVSLGTPAGVARLSAGQRVEVRLVGPSGETLISLTNPVADEPGRRADADA